MSSQALDPSDQVWTVTLKSSFNFFEAGNDFHWRFLPNVLPRHFCHDPTILRLLRRTLGGLDDNGYSLRRMPTEWKSVKEFDICFGTTRDECRPLARLRYVVVEK